MAQPKKWRAGIMFSGAACSIARSFPCALMLLLSTLPASAQTPDPFLSPDAPKPAAIPKIVKKPAPRAPAQGSQTGASSPNSWVRGLNDGSSADVPPNLSDAPMKPPPRSYLIFFDREAAAVTNRGSEIVREAADNWMANQDRFSYGRIQVNGFVDYPESQKIALGFSMRRAQAVATELIRDGVPRKMIAVQAFGPTHLLVPTSTQPDGPEPQNRRVEIVIH